MSYYHSYTPIEVEPGAEERIAKRLKDLPKINQERPCEKCIHWDRYRIIRCTLQFGKCDFYHSAFKQTRLNENWEESDEKDF